jgi:hypothetical protein
VGSESRETDYDQVSASSFLAYQANVWRYGVNNIRELLGHKVNLNFIEENPAVRLDKD